MTIKEISDLLKQRLVEMPDRPVTIWENQEVDPNTFFAAPFLIVQMIQNAPDRITHRGGHLLSGQMQVAVVVREGRRTGEAELIADRVSAHFAPGLITRRLEIPARATIATGYGDPPYWRLPVLVPWRVLD